MKKSNVTEKVKNTTNNKADVQKFLERFSKNKEGLV